MLKDHLEDLCMVELLDDLLEVDPEKPSLYVLSNKKQINGPDVFYMMVV